MFRCVTEPSVGASSGGLSLCVSGKSEPLPELSEVSTRQSEQPTGPHLPEPQVTHTSNSHQIPCTDLVSPEVSRQLKTCLYIQS